jgi:hypothetical protein
MTIPSSTAQDSKQTLAKKSALTLKMSMVADFFECHALQYPLPGEALSY